MSVFNRLKAFFSKTQLEADMAEEMREHLERRAEANIAAGIPPEESHQVAQRQFGNVASIQETARDQLGWVWLDELLQDFRHAMRALYHHRGFTFVAAATLALGLGVNTALFSVFNAVVLRSLPLTRAEELVNVVGRNELGWDIPGFSYPDYLDFLTGQPGVSVLAAWLEMTVTMDITEVHALSFVDSQGIMGNFVRLPLQLVSQNFFNVLGTHLAFGRGFQQEENLYSGANPVIVLQYQFWVQQFHSDPNVLGHTIKLLDIPFTVIGVAAPDFVGKRPAPPIGWAPIMEYDALIGKDSHLLTDRHYTQFQLVARIPAGPAREQARAELEVLTRQLAQKYPDDQRLPVECRR